jgi:GTPase SAR1 family protein
MQIFNIGMRSTNNSFMPQKTNDEIFTVNNLELIQQISRRLLQFSDYVYITNKGASDFSVNVYAEYALIGMFNILFNKHFENLNTYTKNAASLDLLSKDKEIGIQITATNKTDKIKATLEKFYKYGLDKKVKEIFVFVLTNKQERYDQKAFDQYIKKLSGSRKPILFNTQRHIIDRSDIIKLLLSANDVEILNNVDRELQVQFSLFQQKHNLSNYYQDLISKYSEPVLNDDKGMTLQDIYVEPSFLIHQRSLKIPDSTESDFVTIHPTETIHQFVENTFLQENYTDSNITPSRLLLLLGYPGQGKTSFCKRFLYDFLQNNSQEKDVYYFRLKDIRKVKELIYDPVEVLYQEAVDITETKLVKKSFASSILLLDGLDELYMKAELRLDDIEKFIKELIYVAEKNKKLKVIVTSRVGYVELNRISNKNIIITSLEEFDEAHQLTWIKKFQRFHPDCLLDEKKIKEFNNAKKQKQYQYISELLKQPLLIHIIASLEKIDYKNISRTKIYDQLFSELLERKYSEDGKLDVFDLISVSELRELVQEIAFEIYKSGDGYITSKELLKQEAVQEYLDRFENNDFKQSLKGIMLSFYFKESEKKSEKESDDDYAIEFLHKSLQEFMVAEKVRREIHDGLLNKDSKKKYVIANYKDALSLLNYLFANPISREIQAYLEELMNTISNEDRQELADRLEEFMEDFFETDFLLSYTSAENRSNPILAAFSTFALTWTIATTISNRNYLRSSYDQKFVQYLMYLSNTSDIWFEGEISNQKFYIIECRHIFRFGTDIISDLYIEDSDLLYGSVHSSNLIGSEFNGCTFQDFNFSHSSFKGCVFRNCDFYDCQWDRLFFDTTIFHSCSFFGLNLEFNVFKLLSEKHFFNCSYDLHSFNALILAGAPITLKNLQAVHYDDDENSVIPLELVQTIFKKTREVFTSNKQKVRG